MTCLQIITFHPYLDNNVQGPFPSREASEIQGKMPKLVSLI